MHVTRSITVALGTFVLVARVAGAQAAAAKPPTPQDSAADAAFKKLGVLVYPAKGQSATKQKQDQRECYAWAKDQTGFDPATAAAPNADSAAKAAKQQTADATKGTAVKGAAKGAAAGALIGAAAGDAGKGAAIGAAAGGVGGRAGKKNAEKQAAANAGNAAVASSNQQADNFKKAVGTCLTGRGYTFNK
jgi:YmgG-like glycine-zipper protein